jgi:hypothetical protein
MLICCRRRELLISALLISLSMGKLHAQDDGNSPASGQVTRAANSRSGNADTPADVLSPSEWQRVDTAIDRALAFLATQQQPDGSFPTMPHGQPGVTSLCVLAFMAHGHNPGDGPYGDQLERAASFIMSCQKENGLITLHGPDGPRITRDVSYILGVTAAYNHAIASLTLSEIYGMGQAKRSEGMQQAISKSLAATLEMQRWPKDREIDIGGWRYVNDFDQTDSDLSLTGWNLMFLRSARNAGFNAPKKSIDEAVGYVRRTFDKNAEVFGYTTTEGESFSRAMAGAGILALAHAGFHDSVEARKSGQWLLKHSFVDYNGNNGIRLDRYHYSLFNASQAMYQMGSPYWEQFFPPTVHALLAAQTADGSWDAESFHRDRPFGNSYSTALVVLSLGAPNQFLPVFQR